MTEIQKPLMDIFQILSLIVPTVLAVLGWIIAGLWAVKQINMAHEKHRKLEMELLQRGKKDSMYKEFIDIYLKLARSIIDFRNRMVTIYGNMVLEEKSQNRNITSRWQNAITNLYPANKELVQNMRYLKLWLAISSDYIPNVETIEENITHYEKSFTEVKDQLEYSPWLRSQIKLAKMQVENKPNSAAYREDYEIMTKSLDSLLKDLKERGKEITKHLLE